MDAVEERDWYIIDDPLFYRMEEAEERGIKQGIEQGEGKRFNPACSGFPRGGFLLKISHLRV